MSLVEMATSIAMSSASRCSILWFLLHPSFSADPDNDVHAVGAEVAGRVVFLEDADGGSAAFARWVHGLAFPGGIAGGVLGTFEVYAGLPEGADSFPEFEVDLVAWGVPE